MMGVKKGNIQHYKSLMNQASKYVIPRFERTYQVTIKSQDNGEQILKCRGGQKNSLPCDWCKHGRACEHMYRLLEHSPTKGDALPRWHVDYLHFYGRDEIITQHYIKLCGIVKMQGIPLADPDVFHIKSLLAVGEGTQEKSFFTCSLDSLKLAGEATYWHKVRNKVPVQLQQCIPDGHKISDKLPVKSPQSLPVGGEETRGEEDDEIKLSGGKSNNGNTDRSDDVEDDAESFGVHDPECKELFHKSNEYMVPSQMIQLSQREGEINNHVEPQGQNARDDFLHMYQTTCKFADSLGTEGCQLMERELNIMNAKMIDIIARKNESGGSKGDSSYGAFMHLYENLCKNCNEAGDNGRKALADGMSSLKNKQFELITKRKGIYDVGGVASMPSISTKKS